MSGGSCRALKHKRCPVELFDDTVEGENLKSVYKLFQKNPETGCQDLSAAKMFSRLPQKCSVTCLIASK